MTRKCWLAPTCRGKSCLFLQVLQQTAAALLLCNTWSPSRGWQVGRYGSLCRECCRVSLRSCTRGSWHSGLGMLLHPPPPQEQNQGRFCDTFFYFICSQTVTHGLGETRLLYSGFVQKFHEFFQNSPTFSASLQSRGFTVLQNLWNEQHFLVLKC